MEYKTCPGFIDLDKRVAVLETEQNTMKKDIIEIKQNQKEARNLAMTTLVTSLLSTIGIIVTLLVMLGGWYE